MKRTSVLVISLLIATSAGASILAACADNANSPPPATPSAGDPAASASASASAAPSPPPAKGGW